MSAAWAGSSAGIIVIGVCAVLLHQAGRHGHRLPGPAHPWLYRVLIFGMFLGGDSVALTALGSYPLSALSWASSAFGPGRHDVLVIVAVLLLALTVTGTAFVPAFTFAMTALALPFVAYLAGGALRSLDYWLPVVQWSAGISHWIGG